MESKQKQSRRVPLTIPNAPNWDCSQPCSYKNGLLAYCANANVHLMKYDSMSGCFSFLRSINFNRRIKQCRCISVEIIEESGKAEAILVSLDKRVLYYVKLDDDADGQPEQWLNASVSDIAISIKQVEGGMIAVTQRGVVFEVKLERVGKTSTLSSHVVYKHDL